MGHELTYRTWARGVYSSEASHDAAEAEETLRRIEDRILAMICMDPEKIVAKRDDPRGGNNAETLYEIWDELRDWWHDTHRSLVVSRQIEGAVQEKTYKVELCPDCFRQLDDVYDREACAFKWTCQKCGKTVDKPAVAEINTITEDA